MGEEGRERRKEKVNEWDMETGEPMYASDGEVRGGGD